MIVVVGLTHQNASIEVRERFALPADRVPGLLRELVGRPEVGEALLISTCNRVELVAAAASGASLDSVALTCRSALAAEGRAAGAGEVVLAMRTGGEAVRHLFNVAASLDSMVLGEPQILGQVKDAYEKAKAAGTVGAVLHRTLARAIHTAKLVRSRTSIGSGQVSVPTVAVDYARRIFGDLSDKTVLLVGSGDMAETVAKLLSSSGARILVAGRTLEKAEALAQAVGGSARAWSDLRAVLPEADVVITSTSAPGYVIDEEMVSRARRSRRGRNQFYIDLAVPRDVEPSVESLDGVFLYNIDDFSRLVGESLATRTREAERAGAIIDEEARAFDRWADAEQATPCVVSLRTRMREALGVELERSLRGKLRHLGPGERAALETMLDASVNRLLHTPTTRLREAAADRSLDGPAFAELAAALDRLFALNEELDDALDSGSDSLRSPAAEDVAAGESNRPLASRGPIAKVSSR
ncbi:MAG TPA: glutamyl-tRNA reductase [Polyangiaceae bacterium]